MPSVSISKYSSPSPGRAWENPRRSGSFPLCASWKMPKISEGEPFWITSAISYALPHQTVCPRSVRFLHPFLRNPAARNGPIPGTSVSSYMQRSRIVSSEIRYPGHGQVVSFARQTPSGVSISTVPGRSPAHLFRVSVFRRIPGVNVLLRTCI